MQQDSQASMSVFHRLVRQIEDGAERAVLEKAFFTPRSRAHPANAGFEWKWDSSNTSVGPHIGSRPGDCPIIGDGSGNSTSG